MMVLKAWICIAAAIAIFLAPNALAAQRKANMETISTNGRSLWRLASAQLESDAVERNIIGGSYDGRICALSSEGQLLWEATSGGFVFELACGDLDGDGLDEIAAACADGFVRIFDAQGHLLWKHDLGGPVYQVAIARLDGRTPVVLAGGVSQRLCAFSASGELLREIALPGSVRKLDAGDFDGDGRDEVAAFVCEFSLPWRAGKIHVFDGPEMKPRWTAENAPELATQGHAFDCAVADVNGDRKSEYITCKGVFSLADCPVQLDPLSPADFPRVSFDFNYRSPLLAAGTFVPDAGWGIMSVNGPDFTLWDCGGRVLGMARAQQGFTDVIAFERNGRPGVLLGASPNGDDNIYWLELGPGWEREVAELKSSGRIAEVSQSIQQISERTTEWKGQPLHRPQVKYPITTRECFLDAPDVLSKVDLLISQTRQAEALFPYDNLLFGAVLWISEDQNLMRPDGKPWPRERRLRYQLSREQIVGIARQMEAAQAHFWVQVGHACAPYLAPETAEAILKAAPTMCLGFVSAEDELNQENATYYLEHFIQPILDICLRNGSPDFPDGRLFILREKNIWWATAPALPETRANLFNGKYASVIVPCVEDSNSRTPDMNLAGRVGMWMDGQVDRWAFRICSDYFSFSRLWEWETQMVGHPHLRVLTTQASLGASIFMFNTGLFSQDGTLTRVGAEGAAPFFHMLGKGIIAPPSRQQMRSISPVALVIDHPTERYRTSGANGHRYTNFEPVNGHWNAFDRMESFWGMFPTPENDLGAVLWGRQRQFANFIPQTPHGFVPLVPGFGPDGPSDFWTKLWQSDGDSLRRLGGEKLDPSNALAALKDDIQQAAEALPVRVEGEVFQQLVEETPGRYLLYLVDVGYLDPTDRPVRIAATKPGNWTVRDRLTGKDFGTLVNPSSLTVPAGAMLVLELENQN